MWVLSRFHLILFPDLVIFFSFMSDIHYTPFLMALVFSFLNLYISSKRTYLRASLCVDWDALGLESFLRTVFETVEYPVSPYTHSQQPSSELFPRFAEIFFACVSYLNCFSSFHALIIISGHVYKCVRVFVRVRVCSKDEMETQLANRGSQLY